jgi:hypothetical protein
VFAGVVSVALDLLEQWLSRGPPAQSPLADGAAKQSVPRWLDAVLLVIDAVAQAQPTKDSVATPAAAAPAAAPSAALAAAANGAVPAGAAPATAAEGAAPGPSAPAAPHGAGANAVRLSGDCSTGIFRVPMS